MQVFLVGFSSFLLSDYTGLNGSVSGAYEISRSVSDVTEVNGGESGVFVVSDSISGYFEVCTDAPSVRRKDGVPISKTLLTVSLIQYEMLSLWGSLHTIFWYKFA